MVSGTDGVPDRVSGGTPSRSRGDKTDRRSFLSQIGAAAGIASLTGVAGCTSLLDQDPLTVGYNSASVGHSFRQLQAPIVVQQGYLDELDASVEAKNYREADHGDGTVEVRFEDASTVIFGFREESDRGNRILAANNQNDCGLLASETFARAWNDHGPGAFARFREESGGPFTLAATDTSRARLWLDAVGVPGEQVELDGNANVEAITREFRDGELDGVFQPEPTATKLVRADVGFAEVAWSGDAISNLPGGVMVVRDDLWQDDPELARELLEKHVKATEDLNERPDEVASIVSDALGDELSTTLVRRALRKGTTDFVTDPRLITEEMNALSDVMAEKDVIDDPGPVDSIIEPSFYEDVA